jgi:3-phenylpropionate/trans-cinnamate dioxygenase ferredoxin reductase subunit
VKRYKYVIVGGGVAGASAVNGIREWDRASILLIGAEPHSPYHRPPLSGDLWQGRKQLQSITLEPDDFWGRNRVDLVTGTRVLAVNPTRRQVTDSRGHEHGYEKLLLATGGQPRRLEVKGADLDGVYHYRTIDDYLGTRKRAVPGSSALLIGGDFVGAQLAAALAANGVNVTMLIPQQSLAAHVLPEKVGRILAARYAEQGIRILTGDAPVLIAPQGNRFRTITERSARIESDVVLVALGTRPSVDLAQGAGLPVGDGIVVDQYLRTSDPNIFAAGDNALFPSPFVEAPRRLECWENAWMQGELAGVNMTGKLRRYDEMPHFFSELFDLYIEAVGDTSSARETLVDWNEQERTGTVFYLLRGQVRGVLLCNRSSKLEAARQMIMRAVPGDDEHDPRSWL